MLDLISTILQPVVVVYLGYIIYLLASHSDVVPLTSLLMLAAIYGLQAVIFILRRRWEMVGYLMIYILAIPVYSFALPLHAFWNMDKFSWYELPAIRLMTGDPLVLLRAKEERPSSSPTKAASTHAPSLNENGTNTQQTWVIVSTNKQEVKSLASQAVNPCGQVCLSPPSINEAVSRELSNNRTFTIIHRLDSQITDLPDEVPSQGSPWSGMILISHYLLESAEKFWRCKKRLYIRRIGYPGPCLL